MHHLVQATQNIVFDFDSTLVTIEGIDQIAHQKGVFNQVAELTAEAMEGKLAFEEIFGKRLELIQPQQADLEWLGQQYLGHLSPGAEQLVASLRAQGKQLFVMSGGFEEALLPVTQQLKIPIHRVFANSLFFDEFGQYSSFDRTNPLWKSDGKLHLLQELQKKYAGNWLMIGDGSTDLAAAEGATNFMCYTGVVSRPAVVQQARYVCTNFAELI